MSEKLNKRVKELAAQIILRRLNDPRIKFVTVLGAKFSIDLRYCTIYVSIMGKDSEIRTAMRGLQHARGFIQRQIASHLSLRYAPIIRIEQDDSLKKQQDMSELINKALGEDTERQKERGEIEDSEDLERSNDLENNSENLERSNNSEENNSEDLEHSNNSEDLANEEENKDKDKEK